MSWFSNLTGINNKNLGGLLATAAPFIPGVGGIVGGLLGKATGAAGQKGKAGYNLEDLLGLYGGIKNLTEGAKADRASSSMMDQQRGMLSQLQQMQGGQAQAYGGLMGGLMPQYQQFMQNPLDPSRGNYRAMLESAGDQSNRAVDQITADYASRGLLGPNSGLSSAIANSRFGVQKAAFNAAHQAALQGRQQRFGELQGGMDMAQGMYRNASSPNLLGSMGGLAGMYASRSDAYGQGLGELGGLLGRAKAKRPADAGQGNLNTNNVSNPWATQSYRPR